MVALMLFGTRHSDNDDTDDDDDSESGIWIERRLLCGAKREERDFGLGLALDSTRYIG